MSAPYGSYFPDTGTLVKKTGPETLFSRLYVLFGGITAANGTTPTGTNPKPSAGPVPPQYFLIRFIHSGTGSDPVKAPFFIFRYSCHRTGYFGNI